MIVSIDAIDEVRLLENPRAEYGWKLGVVAYTVRMEAKP